MGRWDRRTGIADDRHAAANLVAGGCGKILRRAGRVRDGCCSAADCQGVWPHRCAAWYCRRCHALRHFDWRKCIATILASVPWFLQDLATYGIGIFTPTILGAAVGHKREHAQNVADIVANDLIAAKGSAFIDILLLVGIVAAVLLADRVGRIRLQVLGFIGCAAGLFIAAQSAAFEGSTKVLLIFVGFMLFNFMTNLGPNAQTYLIAGEVFPTAIRGKGAGFAASFAKIGACMTAFLFPILFADLGTAKLLHILVARCRGHMAVPHRNGWGQSRRDRDREQ